MLFCQKNIAFSYITIELLVGQEGRSVGAHMTSVLDTHRHMAWADRRDRSEHSGHYLQRPIHWRDRSRSTSLLWSALCLSMSLSLNQKMFSGTDKHTLCVRERALTRNVFHKTDTKIVAVVVCLSSSSSSTIHCILQPLVYCSVSATVTENTSE